MQYVKIKDVIVEQIESGQLSPRQKLPSERKLAELFDTTRVTLREALSLLEAEGRIYREDRRGWFISPLPLRYDPTLTLNFMDMAKAQNREPLTELVGYKSMLADKKVSELLCLPAFSDVFKVERVRYLEQRPVVFVENYVRPECAPTLLDHDLSLSLTDIYREHYGIHYSEIRYRVSTTSLFGEVAQKLRATAGSPVMLLQRINYDQQGNLIDCALEYWRHDAICIESAIKLTSTHN
ncbi:phosphonate utilization transcriptional regulator PhnR [Vibrio sp. UCD-FRSSP16_10]|uniref:phosphonate utilization transcriptional regulator PhnR n=1 Tax=unclassified Vibrio TaxID=2614977 RepID=UPI0007FFCC33|nr:MULTISPECIES: phosphonate utilization transcriptional regulator PhnR [unclassified Vibrio]OBT15533.1 phosphonate utilization transcriptional regulator PhnR [Vibrio sp. UCD-FRSSP16_30]OBT20606.1 phosphonate utilization transcriptional regulator PhnR [Vibrio sp. UCD-FRSSP16_10]